VDLPASAATGLAGPAASPAADSCALPDRPHLAVYLSGGIGDTLMHLGFVKALAEHAGAPVTLVLATPPVATPLLQTQSYVRDVLSIPDLHHDKVHRVDRLTALLAPLGIDTLFLFSYQDHVLKAACAAKIPVRAGFLRTHKLWRAPWMTQRIVVRRAGTPHPDTHTWLPRLFKKYGYPTRPIEPSLTVTALASADAATLAQDHPRLVGFGLSTSGAVRRYGVAQWLEVASLLADRDPTLSFLLFGAADVADTADAIRAAAPRHLRWLDVTRSALPLTTGHALVARCLAFAGNDSMGIHLAVAANVPTVGLFGASPPMAYSRLLTPLQASPASAGMAGIRAIDVARELAAHLDGRTP
jgi:heptosyltransferase-2